MAPDAVPLKVNRLEMSIDTPPFGRPSYIPGDVVQGEIALWNPHHAAGLEPSITFTGVSKVRFKEKGRLFSPVHSHEDEFLSWREANLARTNHPNPMLWRFRIPIPSTSLLNVSSRFARDEDFAHSPGYALPPSFHLPRREVDGRESDSEYGTVSYTIVAMLTKPFFTHSYAGPTVCQMRLPLSSLRSLDTQNLALHTISSCHEISPCWASNATGMPEPDCPLVAKRADDPRTLFLNEMKPTIDINVSMPKYAIVGRRLDIDIRFRPNVEAFVAEKLSPLILHAVNVEIISQNQIRVPGGLRREAPVKWEQTVLSGGLHAMDVPILQRSCHPSDFHSHRWDITSLIPKLNQFTFDIPSFKTSNLAHSYTLKVWGQLKIDNHTLGFDVKEPVMVLPCYSSEDVRPSTGTPLVLSRPRAGVGADNDAPPPYCENPTRAADSSGIPEQAELPSYARYA
ncbi:MAG: hypothetical protein Q9200_006121 [Gallowayella weberi]